MGTQGENATFTQPSAGQGHATYACVDVHDLESTMQPAYLVLGVASSDYHGWLKRMRQIRAVEGASVAAGPRGECSGAG